MSFAEDFLRDFAKVVQTLDAASIEHCAELVAETRDRGGRLFILGVGGSAGICKDPGSADYWDCWAGRWIHCHGRRRLCCGSHVEPRSHYALRRVNSDGGLAPASVAPSAEGCCDEMGVRRLSPPRLRAVF